MPKSIKITVGLGLVFVVMAFLAFYFIGAPGPVGAFFIGIPLGLVTSYVGRTLGGGWDEEEK